MRTSNKMEQLNFATNYMKDTRSQRFVGSARLGAYFSTFRNIYDVDRHVPATSNDNSMR